MQIIIPNIEHNFHIHLLKHSFSYICKWMWMLWKHTHVFFNFLNFFSHFYLRKTFYLMVNNEYRSMSFTIFRGCLSYSNDQTYSNVIARMVRMVHSMVPTLQICDTPYLGVSNVHLVVLYTITWDHMPLKSNSS